MIFTNSLFVSNKNMSFQLGFILIIINEDCYDNITFIIKGNILHWSFSKCKRVTQSILTLEIYGMVNEIDIEVAILTMLHQITNQLKLPLISLIVCINLYSFYKCFIKLESIKEKCLIINIMVLQQFYRYHKISEIR